MNNKRIFPKWINSLEKNEFLLFAQNHPDLKFLVTEIGFGIAVFSVKEIAPLFKAAILKDLKNVYLSKNVYDEM